MRTHQRLMSVLSVSLAIACTATIVANQMSKEDIVKAIEQGAAPAAEHEALNVFLGNWNIETLVSMGPSMEPLRMRSHATGSWTMGDRFVEFVWEGDEGESPLYDGKYVIGFDTRFSDYIITAMDSFGTYWVTAKGTYDSSTGVFVFNGEKIEPGFGPAKFRYTFTPNDEGLSLSIQYFNPMSESWVDGVMTTMKRAGD